MKKALIGIGILGGMVGLYFITKKPKFVLKSSMIENDGNLGRKHNVYTYDIGSEKDGKIFSSKGLSSAKVYGTPLYSVTIKTNPSILDMNGFPIVDVTTTNRITGKETNERPFHSLTVV
jgi:hypothetical protein